MSKYQKLFWMLLIVVLTAGCGSPATEAPAPVDTAAPTNSTGTYPYPYSQPTVLSVDSAYPGPEQAETPIQNLGLETTPLVIPTPSSGLAVITGQMLVGGEGGRPFTDVLYLGTTLAPSDPSYPPMIAFSEETDPRALQDTDGRFLFVDIKPGTYALIIWSPVGSTPIEDTATGQYMLIEVQPGELKDLGIITIR